jgi:hypothetical protein
LIRGLALLLISTFAPRPGAADACVRCSFRFCHVHLAHMVGAGSAVRKPCIHGPSVGARAKAQAKTPTLRICQFQVLMVPMGKRGGHPCTDVNLSLRVWRLLRPVDPETKRAYLHSGSLLGQLDHECAAFRLATTAGTVSHTGAAGLTLGGGLGRLGRRFGLACDNAASFDIVTADGRFLRASDKENPDLYWGLRGGGGNFGVVTSIEYRLHDMDPVILGGSIVWPLDQARDVLRYYRDVAADAPAVLNLAPALYSEPDGPVIEIEACWSGDHAQGEAWLKKLRAFGRPMRDEIAPTPYVTIQTSADELLAPGRYYYLKTGMLMQLKDDGIDLIVDSFKRMPNWYLVFFDHCGGAYRQMAPAATAFPNRDMLFTLGAHSIWPNKDNIDENVSKMRANWHELAPLTKGFYTNYVDSDVTLAGYRENYGANFERLVALKAKYDPNNLFRLNPNVPPKIA